MAMPNSYNAQGGGAAGEVTAGCSLKLAQQANAAPRHKGGRGGIIYTWHKIYTPRAEGKYRLTEGVTGCNPRYIAEPARARNSP